MIGVAPAVVAYNADIFGPDVQSFNPDRWSTECQVHHNRMVHATILVSRGPRPTLHTDTFSLVGLPSLSEGRRGRSSDISARYAHHARLQSHVVSSRVHVPEKRLIAIFDG